MTLELREKATADVRNNRWLFSRPPTPRTPTVRRLRWPERDESARPQRTAGARVFLHEGKLAGYLGRTGQHLMTFLPRNEPDRGRTIAALIAGLLKVAQGGQPVYLTRIDGGPPGDSVLSSELVNAGFVPTTKGFLLPRMPNS